MFLYLAYTATFVDVKMAPRVISQNSWPFPTGPKQPCEDVKHALEISHLWMQGHGNLGRLNFSVSKEAAWTKSFECLQIFLVMTQRLSYFIICTPLLRKFSPTLLRNRYIFPTFGTDPSLSRHFWGSQQDLEKQHLPGNLHRVRIRGLHEVSGPKKSSYFPQKRRSGGIQRKVSTVFEKVFCWLGVWRLLGLEVTKQYHETDIHIYV